MTSLHLRELLSGEDPCYSGRKREGATTLCGKDVGWDVKIPVGQETCTLCKNEALRWEMGNADNPREAVPRRVDTEVTKPGKRSRLPGVRSR